MASPPGKDLGLDHSLDASYPEEREICTASRSVAPRRAELGPQRSQSGNARSQGPSRTAALPRFLGKGKVALSTNSGTPPHSYSLLGSLLGLTQDLTHPLLQYKQATSRETGTRLG